MNTAFLIPNNHDLIEAVASRLIKDGKDYTSNLVVFPGKRPSHFLRRAIAQKEQGAVIPPAIFSMDEFVDYVYAEKLGVINRKIESSIHFHIIGMLSLSFMKSIRSHQNLLAEMIL